MENESLKLNFYGITVQIYSSKEFMRKIALDFSYFEGDRPVIVKQKNVSIYVYEHAPPYEDIPMVKASLCRPDSVSYDHKNKRYVDYNGKAMSIYDYKQERGVVYCDNPDLLHELVYLLIHSRVGALFDEEGFHRVHAMGVCIAEKAVLCLMPQGGGKTTLFMELVKNEEAGIISDDAPLIGRRRRIYPFPVRIGIGAEHKVDVPEKYLGKLERRKYGAKTLIDILYFKNKIPESCVPAMLLIGKRINSDEPGLKRISRFLALWPMITGCVIGIGLPQMIEFFLRFGFKDTAVKVKIAFSRLAASLFVILKSEVYAFYVSNNSAKNARLLLRTLKELS